MVRSLACASGWCGGRGSLPRDADADRWARPVLLIAPGHLSGERVAAVQVDPVAEPQFLSRLDRVRPFHAERGAGPAVVAAVPARRMVRIVGVVEHRDAAPSPLRDRAGLIDPAGALQMRPALVAVAAL